jgi:hypothetical protein
MAARIAAVLGILVFVLGASGASAATLTRAQANTIALDKLKPQSKTSKTAVVLYGTPKPLAKGTTLFEFGVPKHVMASQRPRPVVTRKVRPLAHRTWLYWLDTKWGARFSHQTTMLLLDATDGKVLQRKHLKWWPVVNGKNVVFLRKGRFDPDYQVYSNVPHTLSFAVPRRAAPRLTKEEAAKIPKDALKSECVISIGLRKDPQFAQDFTGMASVFSVLAAAGTGLQAFQSKPRGGNPMDEADGKDLATDVAGAVGGPGCKDILIYISGHGTPESGGPPSVLTGTKFTRTDRQTAEGHTIYQRHDAEVTAEDLQNILKAFPNIGFKLKIDSCFSGRFVDALPRKTYPNLKIIEAASSKTEFSYSFVATATNAAGTVFTNPTDNPGNQLIDDPARPGQKKNAPGRGEFTNGNIAALNEFFTSDDLLRRADAQGGDLLVAALTYAAANEKKQDWAATNGWTHPVSDSSLPPLPDGKTYKVGSTIDAPAISTAKSPEDEDFMQLVISALTNQFCKENPDAASCKKRAVDASTAVPATGQVLAIRVRGTAQPSSVDGAPPPLTQIHFSDLRPQADGSMLVIATSQAFDLPIGSDPDKITEYKPENLCVQAGDLLALSTEGGFDATFFPQGVSFQIFAPVQGSQLGFYSKHGGVMNGAQFTPSSSDNLELLMQYDLGTGDDATPACRG